jgi:acetylornithine deacetylase/succinyl-diaminopimelate desuccinylase-like protein
VTTVDWPAFDRALRARRRQILDRFTECLRVDTVSQQPERVRAGAAWLARAMERAGLSSRVLETGGNPVVFGERRAAGATRTLLIYCHFDTKPAPAPGWLQPSPFEPVLRPGLAEEGAPIVDPGEVSDDALPAHRLYARGSSDDKGPIWAHLEALELMDALGAVRG